MRLYLSYELRCHHLGPTLLFNLALQTKKASQIYGVAIFSLGCKIMTITSLASMQFQTL